MTPDVAAQAFRVSIVAENVSGPTVSFAIPAWTPGWYVLTEAYKNVGNVAAESGALVKPLDRLTYQVETNGAPTVRLRYTVKATDRNFGFFNPYLDDQNGFVPGPATLMYVVDGKTAPCQITYVVPPGWKVASGNDPVENKPNTFAAPDYDTLADQPADLGAFERVDRDVSGVPFSVVLVGAGSADTKDFVESVFKISQAGLNVFGTKPFPRYVYHFRFARRGQGGMGLEHLNSTVISLPQSILRSVPRSSGFLSIVAHELAHAWNVKRVRPAALGPFDYTKPVRVKDLWWSEGVTEYYAPRLLVEAGLQSRDFWLGYVARNIDELQNNPARARVELEEASLKAWEGGSEGFDGLSYYNKGMLVGLLLDIELRAQTANRVGVDAVMRALYDEQARTGKGFGENAIETTASRLAGADLAPFFARALRSTSELPFKETLAKAGLILDEVAVPLPFLGVQWDWPKSSNNGLAVGEVVKGAAADAAGLRRGDVITTVDNKPLTGLGGDFLSARKPGEVLRLQITRGAATETLPVTLGKRERRAYRLAPAPDPTPLQQKILAAITGSPEKR